MQGGVETRSAGGELCDQRGLPLLGSDIPRPCTVVSVRIRRARATENGVITRVCGTRHHRADHQLGYMMYSCRSAFARHAKSGGIGCLNCGSEVGSSDSQSSQCSPAASFRAGTEASPIPTRLRRAHPELLDGQPRLLPRLSNRRPGFHPHRAFPTILAQRTPSVPLLTPPPLQRFSEGLSTRTSGLSRDRMAPLYSRIRRPLLKDP